MPPAFIEEAERFWQEHGSHPAFRYLGKFLGCGDYELSQVVRRLYCDGLPESELDPGASAPWRMALASLAHPFYYLAAKRWLWRPEPEVDFQLETIDPDYFGRWYADIYAGLQGSKRLAPSHAPFPDPGATLPVRSVISPRSLLFLFGALVWIPALWVLSRRSGSNLLGAFRKAMGIFSVHDGHFARYPCRRFVTYADESNHPCRYLAFKRRCRGLLVAVQNGERAQEPRTAYGMLDRYLTFGLIMETLMTELRSRVGRLIPVGSLTFNERHSLVEGLRREAGPILYDIVMIDQGMLPVLDMPVGYVAPLEKLLANLNALKKRRPDLRVAYQFRPYPDPARKAAVLAKARRILDAGVAFLDNQGGGETYRSMFASRLVITFASSVGFEAFFVRKGLKALFVNYLGDPLADLCPDPRFQLSDPSADFAAFEAKVASLLAMELPDIPEAARARHLAFDGKVKERLLASLNLLE